MLNKIEKYLNDTKKTIDLIDRSEINNLINLFINTRKNNKTIYMMGNGGSATTASHFCCEFNKGILYDKQLKKRFKCICLNDNISTMLAYANDMSYDEIFSQQLKNFLEKGDLVIGISGSGNSKNVIKALEYANSFGADTLSITGFDGGVMKKISKYSIHIPINNMQIAEDMHVMLLHIVASILYKDILNNELENN